MREEQHEGSGGDRVGQHLEYNGISGCVGGGSLLPIYYCLAIMREGIT